MRELIYGALAMGYFTAAMFFLRFWRKSHDRLFGFFALGFVMLAAGRILFVLTVEPDNRGEHLYWMRFAAFLMFLLAIIDKNISLQKQP